MTLVEAEIAKTKKSCKGNVVKLAHKLTSNKFAKKLPISQTTAYKCIVESEGEFRKLSKQALLEEKDPEKRQKFAKFMLTEAEDQWGPNWLENVWFRSGIKSQILNCEFFQHMSYDPSFVVIFYGEKHVIFFFVI